MSLHRAALAVVLGVALLLSVAATGCKRVEDALRPEPKVVTKEATVAVAAANVQGELPEGAPEVLPLWPGSTITAADNSAGTVQLTLETTSTYKDVVAGTTVGFKRAGWEVAQAGVEASTTILDINGEGYEGVLTLTETDGVVTIDYLLTQAAGN